MRRLSSPIPGTTRHRDGSIQFLALAILLLSVPAVRAGPAPGCCPGMLSDQIVFRLNDPDGYEIIADLEFCTACIQIGPSNFRLTGRMVVGFGPYTFCDPAEGVVYFTIPPEFPADFDQATPPPDVMYEPADGGRLFPRDPVPFTPLRTKCMDAGNLDYTISDLALHKFGGAVTPFDPAVISLPENVRARDDLGNLAESIELPPFAFREDLTFEVPADHTPAFRLWPDGLPFQLAPDQVTYEPHQAVMVDPVTYESMPPDPSNIPDDPAVDPGGVVRCDESDGAVCTTHYMYNGAYFHAGWQPSGGGFDSGGLDVDLSLPSTSGPVVYHPAFPAGVKLTLDGGASIQVAESEIVGGSFPGGDVRLEYVEELLLDSCEQTVDRLMPLEGAQPPEVLAHGGILAGIQELTTVPNPALPWAYNGASNLGCGTLFIPAVQVDRGPFGMPGAPQIEWLASAVPTVAGRGIYAGANYNRHRVCADDLTQVCTIDDDCVAGVCLADTFSPKCPDIGGLRPAWTVTIEDEPISFEIVPGEHADREMAFFARASGVTGIFDGGQADTSIGNPLDLDNPTFDVDFNRFGLAFLSSKNEGQDSLLRGQINLPWPSATDLPFDGLSVCDCGSLGSAQVPEAVAERTLAYWDATFRPYALDFWGGNPDKPCSEVVASSCCTGDDPECEESSSNKVCVTAQTPVPHYSPEPDSLFDVFPAGQPTQIEPVSITELTFDEKVSFPQLEGYTHHVTHMVFSVWSDDGSPDPNPPDSNECDPCGSLDVKGELSLPWFGLSPAEIRVQKKQYTGGGTFHLADLRELVEPGGDPPEPTIIVSRKMAADTIDFSFKVDYFPPSTTADPDDGHDADGRGLLLGFSFNPGVDATEVELQNKVNLGAMPVGAGVVLKPNEILSDFGPAAALRLWGLTDDTGEVGQTGRQMLENILPVDRQLADEWKSAYDEALSAFGVDYQLPAPDLLGENLRAYGLIELFEEGLGGLPHPDFASVNNVAGLPGFPSPDTVTDKITGYLDLASDPASAIGDLSTEMPEVARAVGDIRSLDQNGREFFAFAGAQLDVFRQARELAGDPAEQAITMLSRVQVPGGMKLPGKQDIDFPLDVPGLSWDFDYTQTPATPPFFRFNSLTGNLDLTRGGLSGLGFDELGATLKFYKDGDWYFEANADVMLGSFGAEGDVLLGNTKDLAPLRSLDPDVVEFLGEIPKFDGAYVRVGLRREWINLGCMLYVDTRLRAGGWYMGSIDSYGGLLVGRVSGEGVCIVSVAGEMTMIGGQVGDLFKLQGDFWVAGGMGWDCDKGRWDRPRDVLSDGGCFACVIDTGCEFTYPRSRLDCVRPRYRCR